MELVLFAIIMSVAIHKAWEQGKTEYGHTRDKAAAEFSRAHKDWSPRRIQRHARHRARGYWWDQIRHGWPDYRRAHAEARDLAEAERHETDLTFAQRRAELRRRIDAAQAEKQRLLDEEMKRNRERADELRRSAPCPHCGAVGDAECKPGCPVRMAWEANRARGAEPTVPPATVPPPSTEPPNRASRPSPTKRPEPSHKDGTKPPSTEPPKPVHRTEPSPTVPPALPPSEPNTPGDSDKFWVDLDADRRERDASLAPIRDYEALSDEEKERVTAEARARLAGGSPSTVTPITKNQPTTSATANGTATPSGGTMTTPATTGGNSPAVPTGEFGGYEATVAGWDNIGHLGAALDAAYERQMAQLRELKADDATIERVARAREANETHMVVAGEARTDWVSRQGAVKDTKDATGARGDQAMHDN